MFGEFGVRCTCFLLVGNVDADIYFLYVYIVYISMLCFVFLVLSIYVCAMLLIVFADMRGGEASKPCSWGSEQEVLVEFPDLMILIGLGVFLGEHLQLENWWYHTVVGDPLQLPFYSGETLHIQSQRCALLMATMLAGLMYPVQTGKETA